jgi:hypothetical protein
MCLFTTLERAIFSNAVEGLGTEEGKKDPVTFVELPCFPFSVL